MIGEAMEQRCWSGKQGNQGRMRRWHRRKERKTETLGNLSGSQQWLI
jgi:hypothetical protein